MLLLKMHSFCLLLFVISVVFIVNFNHFSHFVVVFVADLVYGFIEGSRLGVFYWIGIFKKFPKLIGKQAWLIRTSLERLQTAGM